MSSIYVGFTLTAAERDRLVSRVGDAVALIESNGQHGPALRERFAAAEACFGRCPPDWIASSPALKWIQLDSVGFDDLAKLDWATLGRRVTVTNLAGFFAEPVAETALAGVLALLRGIDRLLALQPRKDWRKMELRPKLRNLAGANVLLVGYGSIGRRFEELLRPFGCEVAAFSLGRQKAGGMTLADLDRGLASADVVFCSVPETPATRAMFDAARIGRMRPSAIFANVGRGGVVDEAALVAALNSGRLGGAVLDVTVTEPLPPDHALWTCPNVLLTQHTAGGTADEGMRKVDAFADNYDRFRRGQPLHGVVGWQKGY